MRTISIMSTKGGVGKTTITTNLAGSMVERDQRVLLMDFDQQADLTSIFNPNHERTVVDVLYDSLPLRQAIQKTALANLDILPGHRSMAEIDARFAADEDTQYLLAWISTQEDQLTFCYGKS